MNDRRSPIRETDDEARATARSLITNARIAALAVIQPETGAPFVSRIAVGVFEGALVSLVSDLSLHTQALRRDPRASLLLGEPPGRGDRLNHARLSLGATAVFVARSAAGFDDIRRAWLRQHPKSKLYVDFADFSFVRFDPVDAILNGGFGRAYALRREDLKLPKRE